MTTGDGDERKRAGQLARRGRLDTLRLAKVKAALEYTLPEDK